MTDGVAEEARVDIAVVRAPAGLDDANRRALFEQHRHACRVERLKLMEYWRRFGPPDDCEIRDGKLIVG